MVDQVQRPDNEAALQWLSDYREFAKVVRTWFVAWGIGGPVLLMTSRSVQSRFVESGHARAIVVWFLAGVALQVWLAVVNKTAVWLCYDAVRQGRNPIAWAERWAFAFGPEVIVDGLSFVVFLIATVWAVRVAI